MRGTAPESRRDLIARLDSARRRAGGGKLARFARDPLKAAFIKYLRFAGEKRTVTAKTFWGGTMEVLFPEVISINIFRDGFFEEDVCAYLIHQLGEGMTLLDVGAHYGFFSLLGSRLAGREGRVLALEPMPGTFEIFRGNVLRHAAHDNVRAFNVAAYSRNEKLTFYDYGAEYSAFSSTVEASGGSRTGEPDLAGREVSVTAVRIDDLLAEQGVEGVDVVKIDAESSEDQVLAGMEGTIEACRPAIILEVGDFSVEGVPEARSIIAMLKGKGYSVFSCHAGAIVPHDVRERYEYGNLLFLHQSRRAGGPWGSDR